MRTLAASTALLALTVPFAAASAAPITFGPTGAIVDYTVPATGRYVITATGARGGSVLDGGGTGGFGAEVGGTFGLVAGEVLRILVGAAGADNPTVSSGFEGFAGGGEKAVEGGGIGGRGDGRGCRSGDRLGGA